jgi:predicted nucleotidyltransferase
MMTHIEIAKHYLNELLHRRDDLVAAALTGSIAKNKAIELSDIDLKLIVAGDPGGELVRDGIDTWYAGIYIDAGLSPQKAYTEVEAVLSDPFKANPLYDAVILYDPTGFLTHLQQVVRARYLEPRWVSQRQRYWVELGRTSFAQFCEGVSEEDPLLLCMGLGRFTYSCGCAPLAEAGIRPSSMKTLAHLAPLAPIIKDSILHLESATPLGVADVLALEPLLFQAIPLIGVAYGQLPGFYFPKALWMARQGQLEDALHALWLGMAITAGSCRDGGAAHRAQGTALMQRWLHALGYAEQASLVLKLAVAKSMFSELEAHATLVA